MNPEIIADYVLSRYSGKWGISNLELLDILYFISLAYYKETKESLYDEPFLICGFGCILESIYLKYRNYGANSIDRPEETPIIEPKLTKLIYKVMNKISPFNYWQLKGFIMRDGGVWKTYYRKDRKENIPVCAIEPDLIFFEELEIIKKRALELKELQNNDKEIAKLWL